MKKNAYFYALTYMVLPLAALFLLTVVLKSSTGEGMLSAGNIALLPLAILLTALRLYRQSTWTGIGYHFMYNVMVTRVFETTQSGQIESFFRTVKITNWKFTIGILVPTLILAAVVFVKMIVRAKGGQTNEA